MTDANFVQEVPEDLSGNPKCEICGSVMTLIDCYTSVPAKLCSVRTFTKRLFSCQSCGATKEPS